MKRSNKGEPPNSFRNWILEYEKLHNEKPKFSYLQSPEKDELRRVLLREQGFLCGYCGRGLAPDFSDSHIDHFWPQSAFNGEGEFVDRRLDHCNFFQSCGPGTLPALLGRIFPDTCGSAKNRWYDEENYVMPSDAGCEDRFVYDGSGQILEKDALDRGARNMISALKLNHPSLNNDRKKIIQNVELEVLSKEPALEEIEDEIGGWNATDEEGRMKGFAQVARRYLEEERAEGWIRRRA